MESEHEMVKASNNICELCFFNDEDNLGIDSDNKFCLTMSGH